MVAAATFVVFAKIQTPTMPLGLDSYPPDIMTGNTTISVLVLITGYQYEGHPIII